MAIVSNREYHGKKYHKTKMTWQNYKSKKAKSKQLQKYLAKYCKINYNKYRQGQTYSKPSQQNKGGI